MSTATIRNSTLCGSVSAPSSKSVAHRVMICSALSRSKCKINNISDSDDMKATISCLETLGAKFVRDGSTLFIDSTDFASDTTAHYTLNCKESGTTARIMIPVCAALGLSVTFTGEGRLPTRPVDEYLRIFDEHDVKYKMGDTYLPLTISGKLTGSHFSISPSVSSQYVTGMLLALSLLDNDTTLSLESALLGSQYVNITTDVMRDFGINVQKIDNTYRLNGNDTYKAKDTLSVEGDWSQAAFFLCGGAICGDITVTNLDINSAQGDKKIVNFLRSFGADVTLSDNSVKVRKSTLKATTIDATDTPDLVPILAVLSSFAQGVTTITGVERLKYKESDRLKSTTDMINALGGNATYNDDSMTITGTTLTGGVVNSYNDHRIVMSATIAGLNCENAVTISGANAVNKSYSQFFEDYKSIRGVADVSIR